MISNYTIQLLNQCQNNPNTCPCNNPCYNPNVPALIFQFPIVTNNKKKIMLISESPYNFPGKSKYTKRVANNVNEFITEHLQHGLQNTSSKYNSQRSYGTPCNIFEFIYHTFYRVFSNPSQPNPNKFLKRIYWTHLWKRTFRNKPKPSFCACFCLFINEIIYFQPDIIIILQTNLFKELINPQDLYGFFGSPEPNINKIIQSYTTKNDLIIKCHLNISTFQKQIDVIFIPNPSPKNAWKQRFYGQLQQQIQNTFNYIDQII
ncbi:MAG: hypothetical protein ABIK77_02045 [candidate division WOR-3 bacterium]